MDIYPVRKVLELACAAYRTNQGYLKESESVYDKDGKFLFLKHSNKSLVKHALGASLNSDLEQELRPFDLFISNEDVDEAEDIFKYFRRLMFSAVKGTNEFETEVNSILEKKFMLSNQIGYVSSLPHVYRRDKEKNLVEKRLAAAESEVLDSVGATVLDKDCEIIRVKLSTTYNAWNVLAIIDNKVISWMSSKKPEVGNAVLIRAKVKAHNKNFQTGKEETRLNYVKIAQ